MGPETEALRVEPLLDSVLRLENPVDLLETGGRTEASVSLGALKELVLLRGMASMSSRVNLLASLLCLEAASLASRSVSEASLSEASPRRARRSMEALVALGADRLLERLSAWEPLPPPSSFFSGTVYFLPGWWRLPPSWSEYGRLEPWASSLRSIEPPLLTLRRRATEPLSVLPLLTSRPLAWRLSDSCSDAEDRRLESWLAVLADERSLWIPLAGAAFEFGLLLWWLTVLEVSMSDSPDRESIAEGGLATDGWNAWSLASMEARRSSVSLR